MGLVRFRAQAQQWQQATAYSFVYLILIFLTIVFTYQYLKRFLWMAFLTMIAPLVSLTYPIDKAGDGKSQAFNLWFKEYTMNAIIQPIHLLLYTALVGASISLAVKNPIYAIVAIAFMVPAEKFIKKMFGINAETTSGMGSFAAGALGITGLQKLASMGKKIPAKTSSSSSSQSDDSDSGNNSNIRTYQKETSGNMLDAFNGVQDKKDDKKDKKDDDDKSVIDNFAENAEKMNEIKQAVNQEYGLDEEGKAIQPNGIELDNYEAAKRERLAQKEIERRMEEYKQEQLANGEAQAKQEKDKPKDGWRRRYIANRVKAAAPTVLKAAKGTAEVAGRTAIKTAGTLAGASMGFVAGASTGEASKAFSSAVAGGVAGNAIGGNTANLAGAVTAGVTSIPGRFERRNEKIEYMKDEAKYGVEVARQRQAQRNNEEAEKQFMKNKKEQDKWEDIRREVRIRRNNQRLNESSIKL